MGEPNLNPEYKKKGIGLGSGSINLLVTLVVVLIPLGLYLLYMEKQEDYFKAYYHRNLGNIAQIMDTRLSSLNYPWSQVNYRYLVKKIPFNSHPLTSHLPPWGKSLEVSNPCDYNIDTTIQARIEQQENRFVLEKKDKDSGEPCSASLLVNNLISEQDNGSLFELLLLTDKNGNIYYEAKNVFPQLYRLTPDPKNSFFSLDPVKSTPNTEAAPLRDTFSTHAVGNNYDVFCQVLSSPFYIGTNSDDKKDRLFLCGLVKSQQFQSKVKAISANKVVIAISLVIIAFLLTPFLKLWLISPKEPYRRIDQMVLRAAFFFLIAIITIGLLDSLRYSRLNARLDRSMKTTATHMAKAFENELKEAVNNLHAYDHCEILKDKDDCGDKFKLYKENLNIPWTYYPAFELIGAVNNSGQTLPDLEVTARDEKTIVGNIAKRDYFQKALNGPRWSNKVCGKLPQGCAIARITSMNEGVKMTAIAALSEAEGKKEIKIEDEIVKPKVNAMFKRFRTFISPPLPASLQFAVVQNTDGQVLFHSDDRFSLVENFFLEIERDSELMEAIRNLTPFASESQTQTSHLEYEGRYHGIDHKFVLHPLIIPDWTLVVLRDLKPVQSINAEIIFNSIACIFCFFGILVLLMVAAKPLYNRHVGGWNWPNLQYRERYIPVVALYAIIALTMGWLIYSNLIGKQLFVLLILFSALAMSTVLALLMPARRYQKKSLKNILRCSLPVFFYVCAIYSLSKISETFVERPLFVTLGCFGLIIYLIGLYLYYCKNKKTSINAGWTANLHLSFSLLYFIILSILPAWAAFEDAWHNTLEAFTRSNLIEFSYNIEKRQQSFRKDVRRMRDQSKIEYEAIDPSQYSLIYIRPDFDKCSPNQKCVDPQAYNKYLSRQIVDFLPNYNLFSAKLRTFQSEQGKGKPAQNWFWTADPYTLKKYNSNRVKAGKTPENNKIKVKPTILQVDPNELPVSIASPKTDNDQSYNKNFIFLITIVIIWLIFLWIIFRKVGNRIFAFDYLVIPTRLQIVSFDNHKAWDWWVTNKINRFIIRPQENVGDNLRKLCEKNGSSRKVVVIDLSCEEGNSGDSFKQWLSQVNMQSDDIVILNNFESYIYDPDYSNAKLKLLNKLLKDKEKIIHIVSQIDIPDCLQAFFQSGQSANQPSAKNAQQWMKILKQFQKAHLDNDSKNWREMDNEAEAILARECAWSKRLDTLKENIKQHPNFNNWKENDIVSIFSDQADLFYREQWMLCNEEEKRTLYHLALGHQFNPQNATVMQCLIHRGLVKRDPEFKVASESLRRFILHAESSKRFIDWNKESKEGIWPVLRAPFMGLLIVITGILFFSQPETFQALAGFLAAFTAASPILFRIFALSSSEK